MSISLHEATVTSFLQVLPAMLQQVEKARVFAAERGIGDAELAQARLADDMWPLAKQIMAVAAHSSGAIAGVQRGETGPVSGEIPDSLAALAGILSDAISDLRAVDAQAVDTIAGNDMVFRFGERAMHFTVADYLLTFAVPNFYFHASMAYAILRNQGVPVGKMDFLGAIRLKPQPG